jgi:hypothetical protein
MSKIGFTDEERALVAIYARRRLSVAGELSNFAAWYGPIFAFAAYGVLARDHIATDLAPACVFAVTLWAVSSQIGQRRKAQAIFAKVDAFERQGPAE